MACLRGETMALSNAERQRRYRERRQAEQPIRRYATRQTKGRQSRPQRWRAALDELRALQAEYASWLENLPEPLHDSPTAELLETICALDLDELDVDLPRGFGRD
jgi:hypothetical protein